MQDDIRGHFYDTGQRLSGKTWQEWCGVLMIGLPGSDELRANDLKKLSGRPGRRETLTDPG